VQSGKRQDILWLSVTARLRESKQVVRIPDWRFFRREVAMNIHGTVVNGTIVLEGQVQLPDGTKVEVQVQESPKPASPLGEMLLRHAGKADGLPEDLAAQHDHYLYGTPKK
jgi:hypothetical protein